MSFFDKLKTSEKWSIVERFTFPILFSFWLIIGFVEKLDAIPQTYCFLMLRPVKYLTVLLALIVQRGRPKMLLLTVPVAVVFYISGKLSTDYSLFYYWLLITAGMKTELQRTARVSAAVFGICIVTTVVLNRAGVLQDKFIFRDDVLRHSFGFSHPNGLGSAVVSFCAAYLYSRRGCRKWYDYLIPIILSVVIWFKANSRGAALFLVLLSFLCLLVDIARSRDSVNTGAVTWMLIAASGLIMAVSVILPVVYDGNIKWMAEINVFSSQRLAFCNKAYKDFGVSLIGRMVYLTLRERETLGLNRPLIVDIAFIQLLLRNGIIPFLLFSLGYMYCMFKMGREGDLNCLIMLFLFIAYGAIETVTFDYTCNIFLLGMLSNFIKEKSSFMQN